MAVVTVAELVLMAQPHGTASSHQTLSKNRAQSSLTAPCTQEVGCSATIRVFSGVGGGGSL